MMTREAKAAWARRRRRLIAYGRWEPTQQVDPARARDKILELRATGMSYLTIGKSTGVAEHMINHIAQGSRKWIHPHTEQRILAFKGIALDELDDRARIDATGTRRRIQALAAIGWSFADIAERLGCTPRNVSHIAGKQFTQASTVRAITALYEDMWDQPAPASTRRSRTLALAKRNGWVPPLAWDDDAIDDLNAQPDTGEVERRAGGQGAPIDVLVENIEWLLKHDSAMTTAQLAERFGYADKTAIQNALARHGYRELQDRLNRNAELAGAIVTARAS